MDVGARGAADPMEPSEANLRLLVSQACRVLHAHDQEHFQLGHVSARAPNSDRIWIKPAGIGLGEVEPADVVACDLDGRPLSRGRPLHQEVPIHTAIYRRRPDVGGIVHTHPVHAGAFAATAAPFRIVGQDALPFHAGVGVYPSARLVTSAEQGAALAAALGSSRLVVLRNHGITAVAATLPGAVFHALSFERSLRTQLLAGGFGTVTPIDESEARAMAEEFERTYDARVMATWAYLLRAAGLAPREASV